VTAVVIVTPYHCHPLEAWAAPAAVRQLGQQILVVGLFSYFDTSLAFFKKLTSFHLLPIKVIKTCKNSKHVNQVSFTKWDQRRTKRKKQANN